MSEQLKRWHFGLPSDPKVDEEMETYQYLLGLPSFHPLSNSNSNLRVVLLLLDGPNNMVLLIKIIIINYVNFKGQ